MSVYTHCLARISYEEMVMEMLHILKRELIFDGGMRILKDETVRSNSTQWNRFWLLKAEHLLPITVKNGNTILMDKKSDLVQSKFWCSFGAEPATCPNNSD